MRAVTVFDTICPLCRLALWDQGFPEALQTELVYQNDKVIVVVDLDPKGYKERLLAVTKIGHIPCGKLEQGDAVYLDQILKHHVRERWGDRAEIVYDFFNHTLNDHEHYQACLVSWRRGE